MWSSLISLAAVDSVSKDKYSIQVFCTLQIKQAFVIPLVHGSIFVALKAWCHSALTTSVPTLHHSHEDMMT